MCVIGLFSILTFQLCTTDVQLYWVVNTFRIWVWGHSTDSHRMVLLFCMGKATQHSSPVDGALHKYFLFHARLALPGYDSLRAVMYSSGIWGINIYLLQHR